ncbi:MAG TPA: tetratricopeptide repeat protein [Tepidisphaeraceae bacterium]|nr:tetratricopeptide repeat protein [Tepidisphaeraceae bacterium]
MTAQQTMSPQQAIALAIQHHQAGRLQDAEAIYRQVLAAEPNNADASHLLGALALQVNRPEVALPLLDAAVARDGKRPEYHANRGLALANLRRYEEAIAALRRALALKPDMPEPHGNLGAVFCDLNRFDEAIASCNEALRLRPNYPEALNTLGNALQCTGRTNPSIVALRRAVELRPNYAEAYSNLGNALRDKQRLAEAVSACQKAISIRANFPEAHNNLGNAYRDMGRFDQAITSYRQALALRPNYIDASNNLATALYDSGQFEQAIAAYRRALTVDPANPMVLNNLGNVLQEAGSLDEALACFEAVLKDHPDFHQTHNNLAHTLKEVGLLDEALAEYDQALKLRPDDAAVHSNRIYTMHFHPGFDQKAIGEALRKYNQRFRSPIPAHDPKAEKNPDRRLRIGYVSPYFRTHVVGMNLLPLLEKHDRSRYEIFCYSDVRMADEMTRRIRTHVDRWRQILGQSHDQVAELIRRDRVDILVDLTVHMAGNRLPVFARKPAPIQATYLGYCGSTGLEAVDYRLSDPHLDPEGSDDKYVEKTIRLPTCYWCYRPMGEAPEIGPVPEKVTFACLNNFAKVSPAALDLWKQILEAAPGSTLLVQCPAGAHRQRLVDRFGDSIRIVALQPWAQYMQTYNQATVCLDPFPYGGGITTCDALFMGVPVVTLSGERPVGRAGRTLLTQVGLGDLTASTPEEYVKIAVGLANDRARLEELRRTLRDRMKNSPLMDASRLARDVEAAYQQMWRQWINA